MDTLTDAEKTVYHDHFEDDMKELFGDDDICYKFNKKHNEDNFKLTKFFKFIKKKCKDGNAPHYSDDSDFWNPDDESASEEQEEDFSEDESASEQEPVLREKDESEETFNLSASPTSENGLNSQGSSIYDFDSSEDYDAYVAVDKNAMRSLEQLHETNLAKIYVANIDDINYNIDNIFDWVATSIEENYPSILSNPISLHKFRYIMTYLREKCSDLLKFPKRAIDSEDWQYSPLELLEANKVYVYDFFKKETGLKSHYDIITYFYVCFTSSTLGEDKLHTNNLLLTIIDHFLEFHLNSIEEKKEKIARLDAEAKQFLIETLITRKNQLILHGFSEQKVEAIVDDEIDLLNNTSFLKIKPLPNSYRLDLIQDSMIKPLCRFDKFFIRYMAFVMKIPQITVASNDPAFMLSVCLARIDNGGPPSIIGHLFNISKNQVSDITQYVLNHIFQHFSH